MNDLNYFDPKELSFSLSDTGILSLDWKGTRYDAVLLTRLFPFQNPEEFLSVSGEVEGEPKELGILRKLSALSPEQQELLRGYLKYKYFIPRIEKIGKVEEKLGYVYMDVTTVLGAKTICIADVTSNVRQLEGAMNKILAYRDLIGKEMDEESANRAVRDMLRKSNEYIPTAASIIDEVSRFFGIDEAVVKGPSRSREAVTARQAAMYLVRRMTNLSTPDIGREFGGRDHTTVLHALEQVETKLQNDPGFAQTIKDITININSKK